MCIRDSWKYFDFTGMEVNSFICKTWGKNAAGTIEVRLDKPDGELIGTCELQPMNGDVAYSCLLYTSPHYLPTVEM